MLVLHPVMFVHVGIARGTLLMLGSTVLQTISAKLNLECTRLQRGNLSLNKNEDYETLVGNSTAADAEKSMVVTYAQRVYPLKLVLNSAITIMVCSLVADQVVSEFLAGDSGSG